MDFLSFLKEIKVEMKVRIKLMKDRRKELLNAATEIAQLDVDIAAAEAELEEIKKRIPDGN